jgi:Protein of unknown function (DUF2877)
VESCAVAASTSVAPLLRGPSRRLETVGTTSTAAYFTTGDPTRPMLCLVTADAVRLPCALVLGPGRPLGAVASTAVVGGGALRSGTLTVHIGRWWRPPRPRGFGPLPALAAALASGVPDPLDRTGRAAVTGLVRALAADEPLAGPVSRLLGRGPGLTPVGDDVLAGALVTLAGMGTPVAARLGAAVRAAAPGRTTAVSAALLTHAARGECVPQLAHLLRAARGGDPLDPAIDALLRVGHTSGAGLAHGVLAALGIPAFPVDLGEVAPRNGRENDHFS